MNRLITISRSILLCLFLALGLADLRAAEVNLQIKYLTKTDPVILTDVTKQELIVRPQGRDIGGRAYLDLEELQEQRVILLFQLGEAYYKAYEQMRRGNYESALPVIEQTAAPLLDYLSLGVLPGNLMPTVLSYLDALRGAGRWQAAVNVAVLIPLSIAPQSALDQLGDLALELDAAGEIGLLDRLHAHLIRTPDLIVVQLENLMHLADRWRERGEFLRAFQLYRKVQLIESPQRTLARLWVAYCSFYLGHLQIPDVFLDALPEMGPESYGYSLRELIRARLHMRDEAYDPAMRSAAVGKTYASATDPWYPELLFTMARLYQQRGMDEAARAAYREVSILFSDSTWAEQSRQALEILTPEPSNL